MGDQTVIWELRFEAPSLAPLQAELQAAHEIALRLGWICRALNWHRLASGLPAPYREEHLQGVGLRLRMLLTGFD